LRRQSFVLPLFSLMLVGAIGFCAKLRAYLTLTRTWMIQQLDKETKRLGVPRQSTIKLWVAKRLKKAS
jgi:hypothetical protein